MTKNLILLFTLMGLMGATAQSAIASDAYGDPFKNSGFVKDDWQVVCDNTLTCRAAGYASDSQYDMPASILITAKPMQSKVTAELNFYSESDEGLDNDVATLWLNNKNYGAINSKFELSPQQIEALLNLAHHNTLIEIRTKDNIWQISDKGMSAVLLKLDDVQGRVGTALALVSKDNPKRQTPKAARPAPVINKVFVYSEEEKKQLKPSTQAYFNANIDSWINIDSEKWIGSKEDMGECEMVNPATSDYQIYDADDLAWTFTPIDVKHTLATHICWRAAYNEGYGYWLIDNDNPSTPQLITTSGSYYGNGEILSGHKGRGIGDCWGLDKWLWNGKTFVKSSVMTTGLCRGFAGGAWNLPTYVTNINGVG